MSSNPFHGIPLDDGGPKRRRRLYQHLALTVLDMLEHPEANMKERRARLKGDASDISLCQHAMVDAGLAKWVRRRCPASPIASARDHCQFRDIPRRTFAQATPDLIMTWALAEHDRQFGALAAHSWGGAHRGVMQSSSPNAGERECIGCRRTFYSPHKRNIQRCDACKHTRNTDDGISWSTGYRRVSGGGWRSL